MTGTEPQSTNGRDGAAARSAKFEVTTLPVADVDRAKAFYQGLGWRFDIDFEPGPGLRVVQFTPPGSQASIQFAKGTNTMAPGSLEGLILVVEDVVATREDLLARGAEVGDIFHIEAGKGPVPGLDPERRSYASRATFADPDGNTWVLQEITDRLPGRVEVPDSADEAALLKETALHHGDFEAVAPPHDWWDWYGAYMQARRSGLTEDESVASANRYMADVKHVVVPAA